MNYTRSSKFIAFAMGAAIGSVVTWQLLKTKYEKIAEEETRSMEEYYKSKYESEDDSDIQEETEVKKSNEVSERVSDGFSSGLKYRKPGLDEYVNTIMSEGYANIEKKGDVEDIDRPYVIDPEEYGEYHGYETIELAYYTDGVLADCRTGDIVDDIDETVGDDFADHFGDYDEDAVHIRNDIRKVDYEILMEPRRYDDVFGESHLYDDE